jgi:glycosyltransferase involved in cell wall biosynthesis
MLITRDNPFQILTDSSLTPAFRRPSRIGVESAWYGHIPFGYWLMEQLQPRVLVELGVHAGVSYSAFCDIVLDRHLSTRCFAVDTWRGDGQTGFYSEAVYEDFRCFHDARYRAFSQLLRMPFHEAAAQIPDGSVDLLHIDGMHAYSAVQRDFQDWLPKLSDRAVVLFHDTNVHEPGYAVWRLWQELRRAYPAFEFLHAKGLGILAVGSSVPGPIEMLCSLSPDEAGRLRELFAILGERWESEARLMLLRSSVAQMVTKAQVERQQVQGARKRLEEELADAQKEFAEEREISAAALRRVRQTLSATRKALAAARQDLALAAAQRDSVLNSTIWRAAAPLRRLAECIPPTGRRTFRRLMASGFHAIGDLRSGRRNGHSAQVVSSEQRDAPRGLTRRVVIISGEPETPGHTYRVVRFAEALRKVGATSCIVTAAEAARFARELESAELVAIWRAASSREINDVIAAIRKGKGKLLFDLDDLMFDPELASEEVIDAIRSQDLNPGDVAGHYLRVREVLLEADMCSCPTEELAMSIRALDKPTFVVPNGFDSTVLTSCRLEVRKRRLQRHDGIVRIGYAAGTQTHQRDFRLAADAVARVLKDRSDCRLVLFRKSPDERPMLNLDEFPDLAALNGQIEWREYVPLDQLPSELARFDINLAPLETDNRFCEAKSELKYFEAALVDVCTIASPTGPMQRAIREGETGLLARTPDEWFEALMRLVDDAALRCRLGHSAFLDVLWRYGPQRREELVASMLQQLSGGPDAAHAFELELRRRKADAAVQFDVPKSETVFVSDSLGTADVSVVIPVHNYAEYVEQALESVRTQSLDLLDLIVVDDASTDGSLQVVGKWAERQAGRFNRVVVLRNVVNSGLSRTRNVGFDVAETPFVVPLDADNRLLPGFCKTALGVLKDSRAAFAYPRIQCFGNASHVIGMEPFSPARFASSNYIDAMALVGKWAWAAVGGYVHIEHGWEDYDFWCRCIERGIWGIHIPEILAEYRIHDDSMLRTVTDLPPNKMKLIADLKARHDWLSLAYRD